MIMDIIDRYIKNYVSLRGFTIYKDGKAIAEIDTEKYPISVKRYPCCSIGTYLLVLESLKWKGVIRVRNEEDAS